MSPLWIVITLLPILGGAERFNCRGRILGAYYADAKSGCKAFHVCVRVAGGGIRDFRFFCPPGTLFHQEAQTCTDWGDDDPLACPADIYDGQFDLYKIGSGFDTKKLSSPGNRDDEAEFGLQRAETGDRRLSQNSGDSNAGPSDLRAAHSSDFFSGQRDRGRDDTEPVASQPTSAPVSPPRQTFRRPTTFRPSPSPTQYTTTTSPPTLKSSNSNRYDHSQKRKYPRKRPVYTAIQPPNTFAPNTLPPQIYSEQPQNFNRRVVPQNVQTSSSTSANVPSQYKEEYVEVSRVTPKLNKYIPIGPTPTPFQLSTASDINKKNGAVDLYKYDSQSTPGFKLQKENRPFKVKNSFSVLPDEQDFARINSLRGNNERRTPSTIEYRTTTSSFSTSTPPYKNGNSIPYDQEKNNVQYFSNVNPFNSPTTTPSVITTVYTPTTRYDQSLNLNTIAYNTNNAFNTQSNYADSGEDDGQYRPPEGEDDGQYRPELYESELLSGAHSLNIAASGNRIPEDQKSQSKSQYPSKPAVKAIAPRPFRPASVPNSTTTQTSLAPDTSYTTTTKHISNNAQRTFDYFQTYTTTSRPFDPIALAPGSSNGVSYDAATTKNTTTSAPRILDSQRNYNPYFIEKSRETVPPTSAPSPSPRPTPRPQHYTNPPPKIKNDNSYDYAYYDSDPGFSEYDHIEEFGRTQAKG